MGIGCMYTVVTSNYKLRVRFFDLAGRLVFVFNDLHACVKEAIQLAARWSH